MDTGQIKILLEKYFEGQTSLVEEQALRDYFSAEITDKEFLPYRQQFLLLRAGSGQEPSGYPEFETRLAGLIDSQQQIPDAKSRTLSVFRMAAAAAIVVLIGISAFLAIQNKWHKTSDTFTDPQLAYKEAQKTLLYVAERMNTGIEPLSAVSKINAGNEHLKSLKKLNSSMDMLNMVSFINNASNLKK